MAAYDKLASKLLPPRLKSAHKGLYGHVLIVGGGLGMPGAVVMAANAALRVGAGMVSVATWPDYAQQPLSGLPEAMIHAANDPERLIPLMSKATVCVLGPGLGEGDWARRLYSTVMTTEKPLVIDASALRLLAEVSAKRLPNTCILTPHAGEAAALLHCSIEDVLANRQDAAKRIQAQYGGIVVLKGHESLIVDATSHVFTCRAGNPGMATAGMGDVLSGVLGGLMSQGIAPSDAAQLGVCLHATAGDMAAEALGERGMLASDLMPFLHQLVNP